jgi:hypothetical protein
MTAIAIKAAPEAKHTIIDALDDPALFASSFKGESWNGWRTILKAAMALPMDAAEIAFFKTVAGDREPPTKPVRELWIIAGRRSGKDSIASALACHASALFDQGDRLRGGEKPLVALLACDRDQSGIVLGYIRSFFTDIPMLRSMVLRSTATGFELSNGVTISVATNSFRAVRGRAILMAIVDEAAFYKSDVSATPDTEVYKAITPALATLPGSMLIGISSPYRKAGLLYAKYRDHFGKDSDSVLVVQAPTAVLNPLIDPEIIKQAYDDDPQAASAEWGGLFRSDLTGYVDAATVEAAIDRGVIARAWRPGVVYRSGTDSSGGSHDSFCGSVAHLENGIAVLDAVIEIKSPCDPSVATRQVSELFKAYKITQTVGDKYAAGWVVGEFARNGIRYTHAGLNRSETYLNVLPLFNAARVRLLDSRRLATQFCNLERRTSTMGRDIVEHGVGGMDDICNSAALALHACAKPGVITTGVSIHLCGGEPRNIPGSDVFTGYAGDARERVWNRMLRDAGPT